MRSLIHNLRSTRQLHWRVLLLALFIVVCAATLHPTTAAGQVKGATEAPALAVSLIDAFPHLTFDDPVDITHAGDSRLFIVEQSGVIRVTPLDTSSTTAPIFLNISDRVEAGGEKGLLGLAFHPNYASNGYFYVNYTHGKSDELYTRISRFNVTADANVADPGSELILLQVGQPFDNHNAGDLNFGPDGYLYSGLGDGGSGGDPDNRAQTLSDILGKMIRIDVNNNNTGDGLPYDIPPDNPFVGNTLARSEIWAYGLRNPWRFSFDRLTHDIYIGDVGQGQWEEIDFQPAGSPGGENYGWRCYEGNHPFNTNGCGDPANYVFPIFEYQHQDGRCSVTGGYVYRGSQYPLLQGHYLYADYCTGEVWSLLPVTGAGWTNTFLTSAGATISAFGEDVNGELYLAGHSNGRIYRIQETSLWQNFYLTLIRK